MFGAATTQVGGHLANDFVLRIMGAALQSLRRQDPHGFRRIRRNIMYQDPWRTRCDT